MASFSPDGTWVVTASVGTTAQIWDARSGARIGPPLQHKARVWAAALSPDGTLVVTASEDKTAQVWDARTGAPVGHALQHSGPVRTASFSPDGTRVVTASDDGTARVWDINVEPKFSSDRELLADAADALSGYLLDERRALLPLRDWADHVQTLRLQVAETPPGGHTVRSFLRWLLDDPWTRTISPYSAVSVDEFINSCLEQGTLKARRDAERAFPGHPLLRDQNKHVAAGER